MAERKRLGKSDHSLGEGHSCAKRSKQSEDNHLENDPISFAECSFDIEINYREKDKTKKLDQCENMIKYVVALLNSGGGVIRIHEHKNIVDTITSDRDQWMKMLEEKLVAIVPGDQYTLRQCIHYKYEFPYCYIFVRKSEHVWTQSSGLKIPLHRSVEDAKYNDILNILTRVNVDPPSEPASSPELTDEEDSMNNDSGYTEGVSKIASNVIVEEYHYEKRVSFEEGTSVQLKLIGKGEAISLDKLLKGLDNNLKKYVSAFANFDGGKIYFGISDNGIVKGQLVHDETEIKKRVEKTIKRKGENQEIIGIWGKPGFVPKYGEQWTVEFAEVIGAPEGKARCVIIVNVFPFPGGMFLQAPLSWKVDETSEKIVQMDFDEWRNRHTLHAGNEDVQEMQKRFESLTLDSIGKRVYHLKDMVKSFAENVFPVKKGLENIPTNFSERIKQENEKESIKKLERQLHRSYDKNVGFVMMDKAWSGNVGNDPAPAEVICDMFVVSYNGMPRMITVVRKDSVKKSEQVRQYNIELAKKMKLALVNKGGCLECFAIAPQIIQLEDINDEMNLPLPVCNYPAPAYTMTEQIFSKIRESLIIVLAGFESSSFNPTIGVNFLYVLTPEQYNISIKEDPFILVEAPPGTGKTVVAIERIKILRRRGINVNQILYVCENSSLASCIGNSTVKINKKSRKTSLCRSCTRARFMLDIKNHGYNFFSAIQHVVVDEAQNFRNEIGEDWFQSLFKILNWPNENFEHYKNTSLYISCDYLQKTRFQDCGLGILNSDGQRQISNPLPAKCQLCSVIRNSNRIFATWKNIALNYKSDNLTVAHDYEGSDVNTIKVSSTAEEEDIFCKVKETIDQILNEKSYKATDIAVLCNTKEDAERLERYLRDRLRGSSVPVTNAEVFPRQGLVVDSFRRFSGLEAPVVIAFVPEIYKGFEDANKVKIALYSRAMVEFYLIKRKRK